MKLKNLTLALACALPSASLFAAAMDRSGQSISSFFQPNNYAEIGLSILDADVQGREDVAPATRHIDDMADSYIFGSAAFKFQVTDQFSVGLIYDQPFGANATYQGDNFLVSNPATDKILSTAQLNGIKALQFAGMSATARVGTALAVQAGLAPTPANIATVLSTPQGQGTLAAYNDTANAAHAATKTAIDTGVQAGISATVDALAAAATLGTGGTTVDVTTHNYSLILGFKPIDNFTLYAGPVYQQVKGSLSLRGNVASVFNGYDAEFKETGDIGWLAGVAYEIPDIALKASLTYRSKIKQDLESIENFSSKTTINTIAPQLDLDTNGITTIETPQSVNLDFQTGIMANTVAFANLRWANWADTAIRPFKFGKVSQVLGGMQGRPEGFDVIKYSDDQWSINAGVGRKFNEKWAGNLSVGYDTGAGNPVSSLGPTEGYTNVGVGVQFSPAPHYFIGGGVKYFWLGDADAQISSQAGTNAHVAKFEDNTAIAYGLKMGYRF